MLMIGICGASGSGKSTLAKELANRIHGNCVYLKQDSYYKDHSDMTFEQRERINYDEPKAFDNAELLRDLCALRSGQAIVAKGYDYANHCRCDSLPSFFGVNTNGNYFGFVQHNSIHNKAILRHNNFTSRLF